jgi:hypothetical protein
MSLITEDGTGLSTAESYLSVSDADTYWSNRSNTTWSAATTPAREAALRKATEYLDATFRWVGTIASTTQALGWPRTGAYDHEARHLVDEVPTLVENATAELALEALSAELLVTVSRNDRASRVKAGSVEVEFEPGVSTQKAFDRAERMLTPIVTARVGSGSVSLVKS